MTISLTWVGEKKGGVGGVQEKKCQFCLGNIKEREGTSSPPHAVVRFNELRRSGMVTGEKPEPLRSPTFVLGDGTGWEELVAKAKPRNK